MLNLPHMLLIQSLCSVIPLFGVAMYLFKKEVQAFYIPIISVSLLIFTLYIFAIFDQLNFGWYFFLLGGCSLFIFNCKGFWQAISPKLTISSLLLLLYLIPFIVLLNSIPDNFQLSYWDEFADWGMSIKYMFAENRLYSYWKEGYFNYGHYPPAQQLLQYYFLKFTGWSELCLIGIQLFFLLFIQVSLFGTPKKYFAFGALMYCASLTVTAYFHFFLNNIYVDTLLAFYFSSTFLYLLTSKNTIIENVLGCLMLFILVQIKQVGLIFSLVLLASYFLKIFISSCSISNGVLIFKPILLPTRNDKSRDGTLPFIFAISSTSSIFLSYYSWSIFKKVNGVISNKSETIPSFIKFFENPLADRIRDTTHLFLIRLSESSFAIGVKFYYLILLLIGFGALLALFVNRTKRVSDFFMLLTFGLGSVFYFLFVLMAYILFFSYEEGIVMSGFERYTAIYFIAWSLVLLGYVAQKTLATLVGKMLAVFAICALLFVTPPHDFYKIISHITLNDEVLQNRQKINALVNQLRNVPGESKIYFLAQSYGGFIERVFQYSASPMHVSSGCHSIGKRYHAEDFDTCDIKLKNSLKDYDYLALYYGDQQFWRDNHDLFPPGFSPIESGVFKVISNSGGGITLEKINSSY